MKKVKLFIGLVICTCLSLYGFGVHAKDAVKDLDDTWYQDLCFTENISPQINNGNIVLKSKKTNNSVISEEQIVLVPKDGDVAGLKLKLEQLRSTPSSSVYREAFDASISVKAYTRVYYRLKDIDGVTYIEFLSASGGYQDGRDRVRVVKQEVSLGEMGFYRGGYNSFSKRYYPTSRTWAYGVSNQWPKIAQSTPHHVGVNYILRLRRGNSSYTWSMELTNNV